MKEKENAGITGIGVYVPPNILTNADLEQIVDTNDEWITARTGIKERRIADKNSAASDLGVKAAREALEDAGVMPHEIDLIIVGTITPDMIFPSTACILQEKLGAKNAASFDILAGCTGFIYALSAGVQYIKNEECKNVLIVGTEVLSKIMNWEDRSTCVLFGDGAGAVVLQKVPSDRGILSTHIGSDGLGAELLKQPAGGSRTPADLFTVEKKLHTLIMNGNEVFRFAVKIMGKASIKAIQKGGLKLNDIDFFVPHQANIRIIHSAVKRLKLSNDKVALNLDRYGNMSSASVPVALKEALEQGKIKSGDNIVMVAFGAGLTWGASAVRWV